MYLVDGVAGDRRQLRAPDQKRIADQPRVHHYEREKDRQQREHRFLDPPQVHPDHQHDHHQAEPEFQPEPIGRHETEDCVGAARDRDRDRQNVVDHQRASRSQSRIRPQQLGRHQVAAAARRKQVDRLRIRGRDDENGQRRHHGQEHRQVLVVAEREERLLGTVTRRTQSVGAEADPGQKCDQRKTMKDPGIANIARRSDNDVGEGAFAAAI
jgi:hypothetical protein